MNPTEKVQSKLTSNFAFAHNTGGNYTTGQNRYEFVFRTKTQLPMKIKLGILGDRKQALQNRILCWFPNTHKVKVFYQKSH